jgi:dihydropteroate synthase
MNGGLFMETSKENHKTLEGRKSLRKRIQILINKQSKKLIDSIGKRLQTKQIRCSSRVYLIIAAAQGAARKEKGH